MSRMRMPVLVAVTVSVTMAALASSGARRQATTPPNPQTPDRSPLDLAKVLAARYPAQPMMSYIPALSWSGSFRLAALTGDDRWKEKPRREMQAFLLGASPAIAEPYQLASLAGHLAFADAGTLDANPAAAALAQKAADFILPQSPAETVRFPRKWTDDMFMAASVLARVGAATKDPKYGAAAGRLLTSYAESLQRPDGIFIHALEGPYAWGRGNGFALLGVIDALTYFPDTWPDRARVLEIYRKHVRALVTYQSDDGSWREVVDEPTSYRELTVTAMTVAAMARGVRLGFLDRSAYQRAIDAGWKAVVVRVNEDGTVRDVCSSTGAGPSKEYYLNRPAVSGADDRGGAMALLAAIEVETLRRP
ncbi:MAG TPA: glycoside hydrolase family 88 protein [Vicinamibacterales bacterium]|nr:glycoside hydrolase family 88 protein [Vicinamibacterales bacterium]